MKDIKILTLAKTLMVLFVILVGINLLAVTLEGRYSSLMYDAYDYQRDLTEAAYQFQLASADLTRTSRAFAVTGHDISLNDYRAINADYYLSVATQYFTEHLLTDAARNMFNQAVAAWNGMRRIEGQVIAARQAGDVDAAIDLAYGLDYGLNYAAPFPGLMGNLIDDIYAGFATEIAGYRASAEVFSLLAYVSSFGYSIVGIVGLVIIIKKLSGISRLQTLVKEVSVGNMNVNKESDLSTDEIGLLTSDVHHLVDSVSMLVSEMSKLADDHTKGFYKDTLDVDKYEGSYKELTGNINRVLTAYVDDFSGVVNLLDQYGDGNFDYMIAEFPGDWGWANESLRHLQKSFIHVTTEIDKLAGNAANGQFEAHADVGVQKGEWKNVIDKLNALLDAVAEPINHIEHDLSLMSKGDFTILNEEFKGHFKVMGDAANKANNTAHTLITEISGILQSIADGDLTVSPRENYVGSYEPIRSSLLKILDSLRRHIGEIAGASEQLLSGSEALTTSSEILSNGSQEQASTIDQLRVALKLIDDKTSMSASNAETADNLARESNRHAKEGTKQMESTLKSMESIKASSADISSVIKVIQDIAFQTNLLALNASVEAARAGVHGAGFSVVAEEVRNLASRSQESVQQTTELVQNSVTQVDEGTGSVQSTATSLNTIVEGVVEVSGLIEQIAGTSMETAMGITEITTGIDQITEVIQDHATTSEECSAMAAEFNSQAQSLKQLVDFYRL